MGYVDTFILFPRILKRAVQWADLVHICDHGYSPFVKYAKHKPHAITCHDLLAIRSALGEIPQHRTPRSGRVLQRLISNGLHQASHIVCVSEATRSELQRVLGIPRERTSVIYNGLHFPFFPAGEAESQPVLEKFGLAGQRYIIHVGNNSWYKNRMGVLRTYAALKSRGQIDGIKLVLAGQPCTDELKSFIAANALGDSVVELVDISNEALRALYSRAELLLFPSLAEGFGWPVIEAQACGCPVVTSNRRPMQEIGGDAAVYADPEDVDALANAVLQVLGRRSKPCHSSIENAHRFRLENMSEQYSQLHERLLAEFHGRTSRVTEQKTSAPRAHRRAAGL
jgi:glycosyltransferase involved in cell wall biosynthesis